MALLSRLFSTRKFTKNQNHLSAEKNERSSWKPFAFNKDQIRVLLFRECDWRGRKLLFDSQAVQKVSIEKACKLGFSSRQKTDKNKKEPFVEVTNGFGYQYTKPCADATLIGEMMFGAVAMTFRGAAMKVHSMPNPNRLMCTKVFPSSDIAHANRRTSLEDSLGSSLNSMSGSEAESCARDVPHSSMAGDSGFCGDLSLRSVSSVDSWTPLNSLAGSRNSFGSVSTGGQTGQSGGSLSSLQRRWVRSMSTSLELANGGTESTATGSTHRRTRLGLCVIVTLTEEQRRDMEAFVFEHISVVESMLERLRLSVERAYARKDMFVHLLHEGWLETQQSFHDLFCLPRLACPVWLHLGLGAHNGNPSLANSFLHDLCQLIATLDTKATNFFVSTLVTGVLTHHLGWVNSVWPANTQTPNATDSNDMTQSLSELSKSHPYNPLWAQMGDLYGALGCPSKTAKTIVTSAGRKHDCVNKLLSVMSYFIRCGEVKEAVGLRYDPSESPSPELPRSREEGLNSRSTLVAVTGAGGKSDETAGCSKDKLRQEFTFGSCDMKSDFNTSSQTLSNVSQTAESQREMQADRCFSDQSVSSLETTVSVSSPKLTEFVSPLLAVCLSPEKNKRTPELSQPNVFYADQKRLNVTMEILNREMERCKREKKNNLHGKGGNFCSPAGAEWENEDYPGSRRESVEREVLSESTDKSSAKPCFYLEEGLEDERLNSDSKKADEKHCGIFINRFDHSVTSLGNTIQNKILKREEVSLNGVTMEPHNVLRKESKVGEELSKDREGFQQNSGMRNMKRSTSCRNALGDLNGVGLYPDIEELAKMENIRLGDSLGERKTDLHVGHISSHVITDKVNALCRLPNSAITFHLDDPQVEKFEVSSLEPLIVKCVESRKQTASSESRGNLLRNRDSEVVFVLGDDEELKGIKRRSTNSLNEAIVKNSSDLINKSSSHDSIGEPKVVTVRSSLIDLEEEHGTLKTESNGESCLSPFDTNVDVKSSISRSSSINFPIAKQNCIDKITKVFRRYTEIYCDRCKTILKEKRCGKANDFSSDVRREFLSCEKCFYSKRNHDTNGGLGSFSRSRSGKVGLNLIDAPSDEKKCVEDSSLESESQEHAIFEQYTPSDEEMLATNNRCVKTKVDAEMTEFGFEDLHLVELPVPSCSPREVRTVGLAGSLLGGTSPRYVPDMLLQGCVSLPIGWEAELRRDLALTARAPTLGSDVTEAVCLVADTQTWEVHLVSSHTYVVDKPGTLGVRVGMSQLVANMLESLALLWRLKTPPEHCLSHLESKLRELLLRSHALAALLLSTELCSMRQLTHALDLDPNDVPLLLAVACTHSPLIAQRYGLSFV